MRAYECQCGGPLFFHSTQCEGCGQTVGMCASCLQVTAMRSTAGGHWQCVCCNSEWNLCDNRCNHGVCNGVVSVANLPAETTPSQSMQMAPKLVSADANLCWFCSLNRVIPDLSIVGNLQKWRRLEFAKHRVLHGVHQIGLPIFADSDSVQPRLTFDFKSSEVESVSTGHQNGVITIDIDEADSVQRERIRVKFGEPQRTLVGHFRHELGHYFWDVCVNPRRLDDYRQLFGDHVHPNYTDAQQAYYAGGPPIDWQDRFISEYATMHPWEDFAETFNAYLDMAAIVSTSTHFNKLTVNVDGHDFDQLLDAYQGIGIAVNELNRDIGLLDLVPEVFNPSVVQKLRFVHSLANGC
ncbi:hypothetical protein K227x_03980 [Rubripirellula lacrimiformis]|uniref:Zinc-ribbon domain-containing protein n=1 Tax=Rubripirellula lacrimiformis TaxID=1930273 RepID=A0A517N4G6_9BACT|nr:putative zinc-binding metallopeptidase [Rubripirellula lacrimiformis]QDT02027.1 hypothetical protein K227x_03980 [Rubripirellula lacrimiformis]